MGNLFGRTSGHTGQHNSHINKALASVQVQRKDLETRLQQHLTTSKQELASARAFKANGNTASMFACLRRHKLISVHVKNISGMISTLADHTHSLESKLMNTDTMRVMKESVATLSMNQMDIGDVDDFFIATEEHHDHTRHVTNAMSSSNEADMETEEELLLLLEEPGKATPSAVANGTASVSVSVSDVDATPVVTPETSEEALERELQLEVSTLMMPSVPAHVVGRKTHDGLMEITSSPPEYAVRPIPLHQTELPRAGGLIM